MRITNPASSRAAYYDRNASDANSQASQIFGAAPHAATQRYTYTIPSGRAANVDYVMSFFRRATVATTAGLCHFALGGGLQGAASPTWTYFDTAQNLADFTTFQSSGQAAFLKAGDVVNFADQDSSTGGTCEFVSFVKLTEFDA